MTTLSPAQWAERLGARHDDSVSFPLVLRPAADDGDLIAWGAVHRKALDEALTQVGAILFRGFELAGAEDVERFATLVSRKLMEYQDRATKRSHVAGRVYTSTDSPARYTIALHNEMSFAATLPARVFFYCVEPASEGGRTPLADVRRVYERLDPALRERFASRGVRYTRNFGGGPGMSWEEAFQVANREELAAYCQQAGIEHHWLEDGRLRTTQTRPAVARHPKTGQTAWVNHAAVLHISALEAPLRELLLAQHAAEDLPQNTFYGDGSPIADDDLAQIRAAYQAETRSFPWQAGDLLLLDNLSVAHGREPFSGSRKVVAVLADPVAWNELGDFAAGSASATAAPASASSTGATPAAAANDELEPMLSAVFAEILQRPGVGPDDDFFDLGGDSIRAAQVVSRLIKSTGRMVPIRMIFDAPSVRTLAEALRKQRAAQG